MELVRETTVRQRLETPVGETCDVLVIGGGTAGVVAAVAAARSGARTVLVEASPVLGGDLLAGGVSLLSYFNIFREANVEAKQLVFGIGYELLERLVEEDASPGFYDDLAPLTQESRGAHAHRESIRNAFLQMTKESGVTLYLNTMAVGAVKEGRELGGAVLQARTGRFAVLAKAVIDASGDGDMAYLAGANCHEYEDHSVGMAFGMTGIDFDRALAYGEEKKIMRHTCYADKGEMKGSLVKYALSTTLLPELTEKVKASGVHSSVTMSMAHKGEATYINGVNTPGGNALDSRRSTDTIIRLRDNMFKSERFFRENIPGFEDAYINWTGQIVGARQTRYVECEYDLSADDVNGGVIFDDSIGLFGAQDAHFKGYVIKGGRWYGIPYRALVPKFVDNLLVVGRMITSDWVAWMSTRLTVCCFLQGQAAGTAAAMAAKSGVTVRELDTDGLRARLREDGVYLGE